MTHLTCSDYKCVTIDDNTVTPAGRALTTFGFAISLASDVCSAGEFVFLYTEVFAKAWTVFVASYSTRNTYLELDKVKRRLYIVYILVGVT